MHDVHLALAFGHEQHGVEGRHIDAFGETAGVREDAALAVGRSLEPLDLGLALEGVVLAVHMLRFATERCRALSVGQELGGLIDDALPVLLQALGGADGVRECNGAPQGVRLGVACCLALWALQSAPAADDLCGVGEVDDAAVGGEVRLQGGGDMTLGDGEDHHLVVGQQALFDGAGEGQAVELWAVGGRVVHGEDFDGVACGFGSCGLGIEAGGGGHVEALGGADSGCVVD